MNTAVLEHIRCPQTLEPLALEVSYAAGQDVLEGALCAGEPGAEAASTSRRYPIHNGVPSLLTDASLDSQTVQSFAQKWQKHDYYREHTRQFYTEWYLQRYGFGNAEGLAEFLAPCEFVLDAGTGSGRDASMFAGLSQAAVFGVDTAREALEIARRGVDHPRVAFIHADVNRLPFPDNFFDFISCDQVIHHTPNPPETFRNLARKLKSGGQICCYVYRHKAVVREFTDDYVRERISKLPIDEALRVCEGITRLGEALAGLKAEIDVPEDIPVLGIRKGRQDIQRFFHWNIMKCFWNDAFDFFTNNIVNFDWYHPEYCFRYTPEEFRNWFAQGWEIQAWDEQEAGLSCRARKIG